MTSSDAIRGEDEKVREVEGSVKACEGTSEAGGIMVVIFWW
jgi:hypothetical protein